MNEALSAKRTPEIIGAEIRALTASMLSNVIEIGRRMCEAKELLPHGSFGDWIKDNTGYGLSSANNFMKIFKEYGGQTSLFGSEANSQTLGKLSYSKALALLALPAEEREEVAVELDAEHISTRELEAALRERDEARKAAEQAKKELAETADEADKLRELVDDLSSRPVDVAVQEPDPEEIERRAQELADKASAEDKQKIRALEAEAAAQKSDAEAQLKKLKDKAKAEKQKLEEQAKAEREKLEAQIRAAEEKAAAAGAGDRAEAEKLKAETEALKKQLAMSGTELAVFKERFKAWQDAYKAMTAALEALPEDQREKCLAAVKAQIGGWSK